MKLHKYHLPNYDYYEGYRRTVKALLDKTYISPEQVWKDYTPDLPEWTSKSMFVEGCQQAFVDVKLKN